MLPALGLKCGPACNGDNLLADQYRTVRVPEELCKEAEVWLTGRFESLEALITFVLRETIKDEGVKLDQQEEEMVQQRLRDLGYI